MKKVTSILVVLFAFILVSPTASAWWVFGNDLRVSNVFREDELREYLPIFTNDVKPDKIYGSIAESSKGNAYCYMFWWAEQEGFYSIADHEHDWEFIVVYTNSEGKIYQVNYDTYHYYIGREYFPTMYNETHVYMYCYPEFHNFRPDQGMRVGIIEDKYDYKIYDCTDTILNRANQEVGFDPELFKDPWSWQESGWLGRYTAFDSAWKAFWVVSDKHVDWINFEDINNWFTKITEWF